MRMEGQALLQGDVGVVHLADLDKMHVIEPGGVLQYVGHGDGMGLGPGVGEFELGKQLTNGRIKLQPALLHQLQQGQRSEGLGHRSHPEQAVLGGIHVSCHVGLAQPPGPDHLVARDQRNGGAGNVCILHDGQDVFL